MATTLGIDIGAHGIRGALIRSSLRTLTIERYVEAPIEALTPDAPNEELRYAAVRELIAQLPEPPDAIVMAIDGARASLRVISVPQAAKKRIGEVLPFELESLLPFAVDEAVLDHQEIGVREGELAVLAAAVPEQVVAETLDGLAAVGVQPRELAVGGAALDGLMSFLALPEDAVTLLLHLDARASDVCVARGKVCELARTLNEGTEGLLVNPFSFRAALHQTVMKYRAEGGREIDRVLVMGEGANDPRVLARIGEALSSPGGTPSALIEPVSLPSAQGTDLEPSPVFGKALALAGRTLRRGKRLDLRKGKFALPRGVSQLREYAVLATLCLFAITLTYAFSVWASYRALSEERDALAAKLGKVTEQHFGIATTSPTRARELLEGGGASKDPLPRFDAFRVLGAISAAVPASIVHDTRRLEITIDEGGQTGSFTLQGQLPDLTARDTVADALDAHECIEQIERGKTSTVPGGERKNYVLEGQIACPGAKKTKAKKTK